MKKNVRRSFFILFLLNILLYSLFIQEIRCINISIFQMASAEEVNKVEGVILDKPVEKPESSIPDISPSPTATQGPSVTPPVNIDKIVEVDIQGNLTIPEQDILSVITIKPGDTMSTEILQKNLQSVFNMGYFTDVKFEPQVTEDGVKIIFRVLENPKVKSITFEGNELVASDELLSLLKTQPGQIFNSNTFENDLKAINDYYTEELGMTGIATHILDLANPEPGVFILKIQEGLKITAVDVSGNTAVSTDELKTVLSTKPGDYLNVLSINKDLASISRLYDEKYSLVLDEPLTAETSPEGVVTFILTEARVDKIVLSGNTKTKDYVILRELKIKEGDIINKKLLSQDMQKLYNIGYFDEVNVLPKPTGKPGHLILEIQVKEGKTGMATAGVGFSGGARNEGVTGSITLSERNLFGTGRSIQLLIQKGGLVSNYTLSYLEPYLTDGGTSLGATLFHSNFEEQRQSVFNVTNQSYALFTDRRTGCALTLGHPITDTFRLYGSLKISTVDSYATPTTDYPVLARTNGSGDVRSLMFSGLYDTRDNYSDPHVGFFNSFSIEKAGWLGGDFDYTKYNVDTRKYIPIGSHTFALRILGGTSSGNIPLSEQFYLGGNDTLRGYEQGEFLGDRVILFQAEYRFPLLKSKVLQGAVFFDAGNAELQDSVNGLFNNIKTDQGLGVRISIPSLGLGVIRVDYAIRNDTRSGRIAIGIGQTF